MHQFWRVKSSGTSSGILCSSEHLGLSWQSLSLSHSSWGSSGRCRRWLGHLICTLLGGNLLLDNWRSPCCWSGTVLGLTWCSPGGTRRVLISCVIWEIYWNGDGKGCRKGFSSGNDWSACWRSSWICTWCLVSCIWTCSLCGWSAWMSWQSGSVITGGMMGFLVISTQGSKVVLAATVVALLAVSWVFAWGWE